MATVVCDPVACRCSEGRGDADAGPRADPSRVRGVCECVCVALAGGGAPRVERDATVSRMRERERVIAS